ncbi:MAG: threonine synthase [Candidatus Hadarchaeum sp.]|uniref:threonine synthase n=1 Tax=Candidatus Hadarchaeum sp. TaxID=2883567 RepID=UPI00317FE3FE
MSYRLECPACGESYAAEDHIYQCPKCKSRLFIIYDYQKINKINWVDNSKPGIWKFWHLLPVTNSSVFITLGEGLTHLHDCSRLAREIKIGKLWVKDESTNPTTSFKDRCAVVSVSKALEFGAKVVAIASDGNAGPAVAAYAAKASLQCYVLMPTVTAPQDMLRAAVFGATVIRVSSSGLVSDCIDLIEAAKNIFGWHHLTTATPINPYQFEGAKTIFFELALTLKNEMPEWIALPAGGGGLVAAAYKAFTELKTIGVINTIPRLLCVQSEACAPIVKAFQNREHVPHAWGNVSDTKAVPLSVPRPLDGDLALQAVYQTNGVAVSVTDAEISQAQALLLKEGIWASSAGATALAGAARAQRMGLLDENTKLIVIVTGGGVKDIAKDAENAIIGFPEIFPDPRALKKIVGSQ